MANELNELNESWASTMAGHKSTTPGVRVPHAQSVAGAVKVGPFQVLDRAGREEMEAACLIPGATYSHGAGNRVREELPDLFRTCFERDRDRILHSTAFRRLAGKTQVFIFPADHQRTRLTHALEVAQVATAIARACRLNVALTEAIALGHDCGHGPGGHASEEALSPYLPEGFNHAVWGADVALVQLNLCAQTLDGIRNHSWSRPAPATPEGQVVGIADRLAYCAHDLEDAVQARIVSIDDLPAIVTQRCGTTRSRQLHTFIADVVNTAQTTGLIGLSDNMADALAALRRFNYERVYLSPDARRESEVVIGLLRRLVDHYLEHPEHLPRELQEVSGQESGGQSESVRKAVGYVAGMTDKFACQQAEIWLDLPPELWPKGLSSSLLPTRPAESEPLSLFDLPQ